jgi:hypothetical protein
VFGDKEGNKIWELNTDGSNPHRIALVWPDEADQTLGQWTRDGKHFVFVSSREGLNNLYELIEPAWFELWKKATAVRLTAGQIDVLAATPSRDNDGLFVIGRIAQGCDAGLRRETEAFRSIPGWFGGCGFRHLSRQAMDGL